jgi:hypothetical protein
MVPLIIAAAAMVQGLMSAKASKEEQARQRAFKLMEQGYDTQKRSAEVGLGGQQQAFQQLMSTYGQAFGQRGR